MSSNTLFATFYSFKGGVGRTLTLVNTAVALTNNGYSVIIWDMDIEAPGIQNIPYFKSLCGKVQGGFVDLATDFRENNYKSLNEQNFTRYLVTHPENKDLKLLPAGNLEKEAEYSRKFSAIEWDKLFGKNKTAGYRLFEIIREELLKYHPDFVLIDSRTGFTDIGGVCCVQLPDVVFLLFNYGSQNLRGIRTIHNSIGDGKRMKELRGKELKIYLMASMVPSERPELRKVRQREWQDYNLKPHLEIPYNPEIAFNETIWTAQYSDDPFSKHYHDVAKILLEERNNLLPKKETTSYSVDIRLPIMEINASGATTYTEAQKFERKTAELFRLMNYEVDWNKSISGNQIDIFLTLKTQIDISHYMVECKDWERMVGKEIVDEVENNLKSVKKEYPACRAIIVTRKGFTKEAKEYAAALGITLRTYSELLNGIINFDRYIVYLKTLYAGTELEKNYIEQDVIVENMDKLQPLLSLAQEWLQETQGGFFTLLGDYGTGKTSFTKRLTHDLARSYEENKTENRVPVLINLKDVSKALSLENILYDHFLKSCQLNILPEALLHLLSEGKILLIFDGFDEMATQSNATLTMKNFIELNRAFSGQAKIILTCRTHYFKDRAETEETLKAMKRGLSESATELYRAIQGKQNYTIGYLQEFKERQIEEYLKKTLPESWPEAKTTIDSVYNLKDLSSRPVLLDMIVKSLPAIKERGGHIQAADLYAAYVQSWVDRDDWRHELTREGREFLVEELAERIWEQEDADKVHYSLLNDVLKDYLKERKTIVSAMDLELASSEVRTASFIVRDDEGHYGFAHRSFLEFFLAQRLAKSIQQGDNKCLNLRRLSKEVALFLGQLVGNPRLIEVGQKILGEPYRKRISENALILLYWAVRFTHAMDGKIGNREELKRLFSQYKPEKIFLSQAELDRVELSYMDLSGAIMDGSHLQAALLPEISLKKASLKETNLTFAVLDGVNLTGVEMLNSSARHASFKGAILKDADFTGSDFHASNFLGADMADSVLTNTDFSFAGLLRAKTSLLLLSEKAMISKKDLPDTINGSGSPDTDIHKMQPSIQIGHSVPVTSVTFSPDGKILASGSSDNTIKVWDIETGRVIKSFNGHSASVNSTTFSPDGKTLASSSGDKTIKLWDTETGRMIKTMHGHSARVTSVSFSPNGKILASSSGDKTIKLWDTETGRMIKTLHYHSKSVNSVTFSPDGKTLASGSDDKTIKVWDMETDRVIKSLHGHSKSVFFVTFSPDGKTLASGSWGDSNIKLWDTEAGQEIKTFISHSDSVVTLTFSPDGKILASGSVDNSIKLWYSVTGREIKTLTGHSDSVRSVTFSRDGKTLASGSWDGNIKLWDPEAGREIKTLQGHSSSVSSVTFSPDGKTVASGSWDDTIKLWDTETGREILTLKGHSDPVYSVTFSPDGKTLASGSDDKTIKVWDMETDREIKTLQGHSSSVFSVLFSPDGKTLASGSWDSNIKLWDAKAGREIKTLQGHSEPVFSVTFSPDGKTLASGSSDKTIKLWDSETGQKILTLKGHSSLVFSVTFSPDGKTLASCSRDKTIKFWDLGTGRAIRTLKGHSSSVHSVTFSLDGKILVSGSSDNSIKIWDTEGYKVIDTLQNAGFVNSLSFSVDQSLLIAGTNEGILLIELVRENDKIKGLKLLATLYHLPDNEWAAIAQDNRFTCSEGGRAYIYFNDRLALYSASDLPELEHPEGLSIGHASGQSG